MDRGVDVLNNEHYREKMTAITKTLTSRIYQVAFDGHSLANECDRGVVNAHRVWWVQAETVVGFLNGYERNTGHSEYCDAALAEWEFIKPMWLIREMVLSGSGKSMRMEVRF